LWRLLAAIALSVSALAAQPLNVRRDTGQLRVSAPRILFLEGKPLDKLRYGTTVVFAINLSVMDDSRRVVLARSAGRFAISFDLWEERFSVTRLDPTRGKPSSHLSAAEAETACLDSLRLPTSVVSQDLPFWIRLEVRPEEAAESAPLGEDLGATLARLVEIFSRTSKAGDTRTRTDAGPFRLRDLH
jgi:hypothetical protein